MDKNPTTKETKLLLYHYNYPRENSLMDNWKKEGTYMFDITVFTIMYNGYGRFLDNWVENVRKQTIKPAKKIVVLGKEHGVDKSKYRDILFIECDSDVMGVLRNKALEAIKTEWLLYFSADDELLPTAIEQIKNKQEYDIITLKYIDRNTKGHDTIRESAFFELENIKNWRKTTVPGYIAVRRMINNVFTKYEDIEIPNYPYLFKLATLNPKVTSTDDVVAIYHRRENSHGDISLKTQRFKTFVDKIDKYASEYNYNTLVKVRVLQHYNDTQLERKVRRREILEVIKERANELVNARVAVIIGGTNESNS